MASLMQHMERKGRVVEVVQNKRGMACVVVTGRGVKGPSKAPRQFHGCFKTSADAAKRARKVLGR